MGAAIADEEDIRGKGVELPAVFGEFGLDALGAGKPNGLLAPLCDYNVEMTLLPLGAGNRDTLDATLLKKIQKHDMARLTAAGFIEHARKSSKTGS